MTAPGALPTREEIAAILGFDAWHQKHNSSAQIALAAVDALVRVAAERDALRADLERQTEKLDASRDELGATRESREVWKAQSHEFASKISRLEADLRACAETLADMLNVYAAMAKDVETLYDDWAERAEHARAAIARVQEAGR